MAGIQIPHSNGVELEVEHLLGVLSVDLRLVERWTRALPANGDGGGADELSATAARLTKRASEAKRRLQEELEEAAVEGPVNVHLPPTRLDLVRAMVDINRAFASIYEAVAGGTSGDLREALIEAAEAERTQAAVLATHLPGQE